MLLWSHYISYTLICSYDLYASRRSYWRVCINDAFPFQAVQSSQEDWLRAVYSFGVLAMSKLPADNPASPILLSLTEEIKRQMDA